MLSRCSRGVAYQQSKALWIHGVYRHQILCNTRPEPKIVCNRQKSSKFTFGLSTIYDRRNQILDVDATTEELAQPYMFRSKCNIVYKLDNDGLVLKEWESTPTIRVYNDVLELFVHELEDINNSITNGQFPEQSTSLCVLRRIWIKILLRH